MSHLQRRYEDVCHRILKAEEYLEALQGTADLTPMEREEVRRCIQKTEQGIERLKFERKTILDAMDRDQAEIISLQSFLS